STPLPVGPSQVSIPSPPFRIFPHSPMASSLRWPTTTALLLTLLSLSGADVPSAFSYDPDFGVFLGELPNLADGDVSGRVYAINETALQIVNFTYNGNAPDLYFWLDKSEHPTTGGVKIPSFEFGITPLGAYENAERVVLLLPGTHKLKDFKSFSLFCFRFEHNFSSLHFPHDLADKIPKHQFLTAELKGSRYNVGSGPIMVVDRRTIKVFGFTFEGDKAPDGYFFVGRGPNVNHDSGVKVPIKGRDTTELITAMTERYRGGQDIILILPEEYDIEHIDWLAIYCYKFRVDFGHVTVSNISQRIPPYVPAQKRFDEMDNSKVDKWPALSLLGNKNRLNFTFQLGAPGGKKGYAGLTQSRPSKYVWYVNGYIADVYLKRGTTYTFIVEGGNDKTTSDGYNPLYISEDPFGGYSKLSADEKASVKVHSGSDPSTHVGRLCAWTTDGDVNPDSFASFIDFRNSLDLKCEPNKAAVRFTFTPDEHSPATLYFNSFSSFNMGYKLHIVDELPALPDWKEEPYDFEHWRLEKLSHESLAASSSLLLSPIPFLVLLAPLLF
ncbi:hypothetical protein PENTCL1PPCAC_28350, partial [Pristionchus entomophagus]